MTIHLHMQWPSAAVSRTAFARHLVTLANEVHFLEIGLAAASAARLPATDDRVGAIRHALEEAMETDAPDAQPQIAARLSALLQSLEDAGLSLVAKVEQRVVEGAVGVGRIDVLSIVVERRAPREPRVVAEAPPHLTAA